MPASSHRADHLASRPSRDGLSGTSGEPRLLELGRVYLGGRADGPGGVHGAVTVLRVLRLHDTATGTVRPLELREEGHVSIYVCGPTVYDVPHLGHGRFSLVFDVLRRFLEFRGLEVRYVSNITDIDDHIITRAAEGGPQRGRGRRRVRGGVVGGHGRPRGEAAHRDPPRHGLRGRHGGADRGRSSTRGVAYETTDGVYLSVDRIDGYGLLARQDLDSLRVGGARRSRRGEALAAGLRAVEEGPAR